MLVILIILFTTSTKTTKNKMYDCLSLIMADSAIRINDKHHSQTLWKSVNIK